MGKKKKRRNTQPKIEGKNKKLKEKKVNKEINNEGKENTYRTNDTFVWNGRSVLLAQLVFKIFFSFFSITLPARLAKPPGVFKPTTIPEGKKGESSPKI